MTILSDPSDDTRLADAYAAAGDTVARLDKDRWLAALYAPASHRRHLHALWAFSAEIARIRDTVSDPLPGEVRARWWADMLAGRRGGEGEAHPVACCLLDTIRRFALPLDAFDRLIEARIFDLYDDPMGSTAELEAYCGDTSSALIRLGSLVLADGRDPGGAEVAGHAGVALALTGLLRAFPFHASRGQIFVPAEILERHRVDPATILAGRTTPGLLAALADVRARAREALAETRRLAATIPRSAVPLFLPVALVEPWLDRMDRPGYDPFRSVVELPQWRRQWRMWRAARRAETCAAPG
ncbi:phytoene/squalene synthase family protein [Siculibacillus lacustris]|uniref:Phytoene/squalene synthase family protein n=1 Tax=Siculibacillus lacustris TaxID=1549641 RepID=A0A4Q9VI15_9HYPH|nr:phytoene/squalene synthase family protein [Siculibacillus lacustris]TBW34282.1 phytoene/squalene synthase family protein [Siculibacillus lacustris]